MKATRPTLVLIPLLALLAPCAAANAGKLSARQIDRLVQAAIEAGPTERFALAEQLGPQDVLTDRQVERWKKKLLELTRKGRKADLKGTNYLYDEKNKVGKYLVSSKSGKNLVLGLHGGGAGAGDAGSAQSAFGGTLAKTGSITLFPEVLKKTEHGWGEEQTERFVLELIEAVKRTRKVDTNRIYLTGHSMGGYGTWTIGARNADLFAGLAAFAGAPTPILDPSDPQRRTVIDIEEGILPNLRNLPISIYQSLDDRNVPPFSNLFAAGALARLQQEHGAFQHRWELVEDRGHGFPKDGPGPGIEWAMSHTRNPRPTAILWQPVRPWKRMFYWLYWREPVLGGVVSARVHDNRVAIACDSQVEGMSILVDERLFDLKTKITVTLNGEVQFDDKVSPTLSTMVLTAAERNDPELLFTARIDL